MVFRSENLVKMDVINYDLKCKTYRNLKNGQFCKYINHIKTSNNSLTYFPGDEKYGKIDESYFQFRDGNLGIATVVRSQEEKYEKLYTRTN